MDERLHNGGAMAFGNDGKLYVTTGDAGKRKNAGTFDDVHGSIIRLNEDGTVPDDNPYTKASGYSNSYRCADTEGRVPKDAPDDSYCAEVWANGLRNPFRIDMDPNEKDKVKFSFGVVGAQHIESIYYGGTDYKGTNYGWPKYEGVCYPGDMENCQPNEDPSITMPFHWYEHISYEDGGCIGGQAHVPEGIWPTEFKYLFIDFILLKIYSLEENRPDRACAECSPPLPPTRNETFYRSTQNEGDNINEARLVEMWFGPYKDTQALYLTKFGNYDTIIRIRYNGILNKPPIPAFDFNYAGGVTVQFDASRTSDPEGDELKYEWDFGDDSAVVVDQMIISHQYAQPGEYAVTLKVTDTSGQEQQVSDTIKIGTAPILKILLPYENSTFAVGQSLRLKGEATDFLGNPIPDERLTWEVRQHHADHFHPFLDPTKGNNFDLFAAPKPEDYLAATNSFLKVVLTARDEYGLSETVSVDVQPHIIMLNVTTQPPGLDVVIDGYGIETPQTIASWKGFKLPVTVADQPPYVFKEWSDGRIARNRKFDIYQQPNDHMPQVRAIFCSDLATKCENNEDCCSGYCSASTNGMCAPITVRSSNTVSPTASPTSLEPPSYVMVPDPPASDLEINVVTPPSVSLNGKPPLDNPKKPILDEESSLFDNTSISASLSDNNNDGDNVESEGDKDPITAWILYLSIAVAVLVIAWFVARCMMYTKDKKNAESEQQKSYFDDEPETDHIRGDDKDASSKTGSDEYYYDGRNIKATGTGSTEESEDQHNPIGQGSPVFQNDDSNSSDISLSFLVPESISSEPQQIDDIENQACDATGSPVSASVADSYLMPPISPASSLKNPGTRLFDDLQEEHNTEVEGLLEYRFDAASTSQSSLILPPPSPALGQKSFDAVSPALGQKSFDAVSPALCQKSFNAVQEEHNIEVGGILEYRFDAASTSQSSLILPPQSPALGQKSFNEELKNRSVSLSMPSPEKSVILPTPDTNILLADNTQPSASEESFEDRNLEEPSEVIESLVLNYFCEKARTQDETNDDTSTSSSPPLSDTGDVSQEGVLDTAYLEDEIDEDDSLLDLLLSTDIEEDFLKSLNLHHTDDSELMQQDDDAAEVSHEVLEADINSVDPTKLTEDTSILSQLCVASFSEETEGPAKKAQQFSIKTVFHENSDIDGAVDLSPLKSPTLKPKRPRETENNANVNFMSPEVNNYPQKQEEKETPDTLSMSYDALDFSSVDNSMSVDTTTEPQTPPKYQPSKSIGVNLQSSFAASAN
jgi:hypothetical protein